MDEQEFKSVLLKETMKAFNHLLDGNESKEILKEKIERFGIFRVILGNTQIIQFILNEDCENVITFAFSPHYMMKNRSIVVQKCLQTIMWKFTLAPFNYDSNGVDDEDIFSWLSRGKISIIKNTFPLDLIGDLETNKFADTFS